MTAVTMQSRPRKAQDIMFQSMPPDTILLNLNNGYYYSTNPIGAAVWERCDGQRSIADIITELRAAFDAPDEIERDVVQFVEHMADEKLLIVDAAN
ncbi:pyrroloquinoline quinone biosynthesis peptide chaperone PqqD [Paenibacillus sp.]|uniref:pyrroloquinoline quinone biosynthesis peptide chaperone PqqD n=1 Tax=Paenibacillus sp. TaxID=58172 RepID=UPI002D598C3F|nr:pyrroloquinoline quinone biosynthesis peptide chaperone PqqD [Paenibacillus sp.]HZG88385.1 pyrroloquinoline quinone biosynthesis peptide chaperone PqqD [Paenibacillus sp.]